MKRQINANGINTQVSPWSDQPCEPVAVIENTHTQPLRVKGLQCGQATKNIMEAAVKASWSSAPLGQVEDKHLGMGV